MRYKVTSERMSHTVNGISGVGIIKKCGIYVSFYRKVLLKYSSPVSHY